MQDDKFGQMDTKEIELPETTYVRDIESRVLQAIALQCMAKIEGINLLGGNLIDNLLGREGLDRIKGVHVEQDQKKHSVYIRVEVNIKYGISIPEKAEEIQRKIVEEICQMTGLHVSCVHVIFKNLLIDFPKPPPEPLIEEEEESEAMAEITEEGV